MKPLTATLAIILFIFSASAQIIQVKNTIQTDIAKVISDYPNGFKNISGAQLIENPQTTEFESRVEIKDALKCRVIKYSSNTKEIFSWEAEMLRTEDFEEASKKFRSCYSSLQHLSVNVDGVHAVFREYIQPSESIKFTTIVFDAGNNIKELDNLKIALVLEAEMLDWAIRIQVYEKQRDDKDRGPIID